jgi:branched-chain amino acid aminotransferase
MSNTSTDAPSSVEAFRVVPNAAPHTDEERADALADLRFGVQFTDHMARVTWTAEQGWHDRRVEAYGPLQLDPASAVLHYGQEVFEGLKAYRWADGSVWAFRPEANAARLARSAWRLALPELPVEDFIGSIEALVRQDVAWVPGDVESSLYLRPFMYAQEAFLGVRPAQHVEYLVIASPVGPYFASGLKPVSIWIEKDYHRSGPGGTGAAKCGGNYAASLMPQMAAYARGYEQVLYLDARSGTLLEELGGMNVFIVLRDGTVVTPVINGNILEGITRSSVIALLGEDDIKTVERDITIAEVRAGLESGDIAEVFACGTAAVVTPIGKFGSDEFEHTVGDGEPGPVTTSIRQRLTDIQYGRAEDSHGWMRRIV